MDAQRPTGSKASYTNHQQVFRFYLPPPPPFGCPPLGIPFPPLLPLPPPTPLPSFSVSPCYQNFAPMGNVSLGPGNAQCLCPNVEGGNGRICYVCSRFTMTQPRDLNKCVCNRCKAFFRRFVRKERQGGRTWPCLTTRKKVTFPLAGDEEVVCSSLAFRDSCQACRFICCVKAGMKVSSVTFPNESVDLSFNNVSLTSSNGKNSPRRDEEVGKTKEPSQPSNNVVKFIEDEEFEGKKITLLKKDPTPLLTSPQSDTSKKGKARKNSTDSYNATNADYNNKRWNRIMGPFLKNQPTVEDQLLAKLSRGLHTNRAKLVSPVGEDSSGDKAVTFEKHGADVFNLEPHALLPSIKVANIRRQENEMLAEKMINAKSLLISEKKEEKRLANQRRIEEVVRNSPATRYDNVKKVVNQNNLQAEIDNCYSKFQELQQGKYQQPPHQIEPESHLQPLHQVEKQPQQPFTLTPLVPLGNVFHCDDENNMEMTPVNPREVEQPIRDATSTNQDLMTINDLSPDSAFSSGGDSGDFQFQSNGGTNIFNFEAGADNVDFLNEFLGGGEDSASTMPFPSYQSDASFLCSLTEGIREPNILDSFVNDQVEEPITLESIINNNARLADGIGI